MIRFGVRDLEVSDTFPELVQPVPAALAPNAVRVLELLTGLQASLDRTWAWGTYSVRIESGYRPPALNAAVGGVPDSHHLQAAAADVSLRAADGALAPSGVYAFARSRLLELAAPGEELELLESGTSLHVALEDPPVWAPDGWEPTRRAELPELLAWGILLGLVVGALR